MAATGEVLRPNMPEKVELSGESPAELHVLAVDDSLVDRKVIEKLLKISSCKVTAVESGTRALQYLGLDGEKNSVGFNSLKVNLIMTDYSMPGMTGYELLKRIKESSAFREVPVVIMSSENILTRIDRCLEEGAEEFIVKPVKLSDVNRLKNFVMKGEGKDNQDKRLHKRKKLQDDACLSSSSLLPPPSPPPPPPPPPLFPSSSPLPLNREKLPQQHPISPSSLSSPRSSLKRPRLQHSD